MAVILTPRGFPYPDGNHPVREVDAVLEQLAKKIDTDATTTAFGVAGSRPPAGASAPRLFFALDWGILYLNTGTTWRVATGHTGALTHTTRRGVAPGFEICTGQAILSTNPAHADLRAALIADGRPWGQDGSGNPLAPPAPGRHLLVAGAGGGLTVRALGASGGAERVTIGQANLPDYELPNNITSDGGYVHYEAPGALPRFVSPSAGGNTTYARLSVRSGGGGQSMENMGPWTAVNLWIQL